MVDVGEVDGRAWVWRGWSWVSSWQPGAQAQQAHALTPRQQRLNDLIARRRAAVETTFATLKRRMGLGVIRYRGLAKARAQVLVAAIAFNLRRWTALSPA